MEKKKIFEIMAIILIAIFCVSLAPKSLQNDTFYTIKIGEHIIKNGGIDMLDPFSWHEGLEYTYPHWLYDVIIYLIYSIGGMAGIYISTCIFSAILGICIYKVNSKISNNQFISFIITLGVMYILRDYIAARAQLVTFILFIVQIFFIEKLVDTNQKRYGIGLIIISVLIANLHVAVWPFMFILYLPYIAEYIVAIIEEKIAKKFGKEVKQNDKITINKRNGTKYLIIVILICILTGFLTPLGTTPYTYLYKTMKGNTTKNISEHLPMTLINAQDILCVTIMFVALLAFTKTKMKLTDLLMITGLTLLMLFSKRQSTMFVIIGSVILNKLITSWLENEKLEDKMVKIFTTVIGGILLSVCVIALSVKLIIPKLDDSYISSSTYPIKMSDFILQYFEENNIDLKDVRLYNEYNYGSYLLYKGIPVFIDSRCDLYAPEYNGGQDIFMDFIESSNLSVWFENIFRKYDITHVILYKNSKMNMVIKEGKLEGYELLKEDANFVFYKIDI